MSLFPAVVEGVAASTSAVVVTRVLAGRWLKKLMAMVRSLHWIADSLDSESPGGMTEAVDNLGSEVARLRAEVEQQRQGAHKVWEVD